MLMKTGTVGGTGANIDVTLGAVPNYIRLLNISGLATLEWTDDMDDGWGLKTITNGTMSMIATGGITPLGDDEGLTVAASHTTVDGDSTTLTGIRGFRIGADTDINVSGESGKETILYMALCYGHDSD